MTRKFKKVYIVVQDNEIFRYKGFPIESYPDKESADRACEQQRQKALAESKMHHSYNKPIPQYKVHGFYLVHEVLF
jgi:hypothetical protein